MKKNKYIVWRRFARTQQVEFEATSCEDALNQAKSIEQSELWEFDSEDTDPKYSAFRKSKPKK